MDKFADFHGYHSSTIESAQSDSKSTIDFSPNEIHLTITELLPFRDLLFRGTTCQLIHTLVCSSLTNQT